jgi:hypothetical protein
VDEPAKEAPALAVRQHQDDPAIPRGRSLILMGEYGPHDFAGPVLSPTRVEGPHTARFRALGLRGAAEVAGVEGLVTVEQVRASPWEQSVVVSPAEGAGTWVPFRFTLKSAQAELTGSGVLLNAFWRVRHWGWTTDPREDEKAFRDLVATEPAFESLRVPAVDFRWGGGGPAADLAPDRFATVAETELTLPEGEYELITISDDGVRVFVDGTAVIDDWTWHAPKEDRARVRFGGTPQKVRIEHFEIDGYAVLAFRIRKVD